MDDPRSVLESNQIFFIKRRSSSIDAELSFLFRLGDSDPEEP